MSEENNASAFSMEASRTALLEQLRQQVSNLMAAAQLLTPVIRERGEMKYDQYLAIMNQSFYRMLRLMNHLELAQDEMEGGIPFRPAALDLAGLCRELADQVHPLAAMAGVRFHYESETAGLITTGDAALLRSLLLGLISNAIKAAGEGGEAGLMLTGQKSRAILTVWDNGPGLAGGEAHPAQRYRPDGALGLGLPIARALSRLHGGAVMLESRPERGTRAVVSLPIHSPEPGGVRTPVPPRWNQDSGFSPALVELADLLPYEAFMPEDVE